MLPCPRCNIRLKRHAVPGGLTWSCPRCDGRTASMAVLRTVFEADTVRAIWSGARVPDARRGVRCPSCLRTMREVTLRVPGGAQTLDVCQPCAFVWFDANEYQALPEGVPDAPRVAESRPGDPRAILAVERANLERHHEAERSTRTRPEAGWKWLPGLMGMPVEFDHREPAAVPVATWSIIALVTAVSLLAFQDLEGAIARYGFRPDEPWRLGGLSVLTAFFLHAGYMHLIGNMYFLWIFGDNSEGSLGVGRYLLLIALATITGGVLHTLMTDTPSIPAVGASGGISGVIAYYALRFPKTRIGLLFFLFWWVRIPALVALALWVGMQLFGAFVVEDNVAYMAHLGGAIVGVAFWGVGQLGGLTPKETVRPGSKQRYGTREGKGHGGGRARADRYRRR